jgi:hypothetical protein
MSYWTIIPNSIKFIILLAVGTSFFSTISTMGIVGKQAIRTDVIASSMCFVNMHASSRVNISWDYTPFVMAVPTSSLITFFETKDATVSPYPLTIPLEGSEEREGVYYFTGRNIEEFAFRNEGMPEVSAS